MIIKESMDLGGAEFSLEVGKIATQAHGSVVVRHGDTVVLAACCGTEETKVPKSFFPLTVDYRENFYATGKFPGGFFKREGRATTKEVLVARMIDRPLRPMFEDGYMGETQIQTSVLSADTIHDGDVCAMVASMAATYLSPLPFHNPMAAVRVGLVDGSFLVNPTTEQREKSLLDLLVAGTKDAIAMVEAGAKFVSEAQMVDALEYGHEQIKTIIALIEAIYAKMDITRWSCQAPEVDSKLLAEVEGHVADKMVEALTVKGKHNGDRALKTLRNGMLDEHYADDEDRREVAKEYFQTVKERVFRDLLLNHRKRTDGRALDEIRPIWGESGYLPRTHGSALFTRGETQALVTLTMGTASDAQVVDSIVGESRSRFMLHYNFPSFSVGEVRPNRGPGRREIGHGKLAERALEPMIPTLEEFPYTLRLVSEILESNGSSSMASVCGGCMAMLDAGVPLQKSVAGVAMGLVKEGDKYAILSDIQGAEDHYGDMDFKVTGSEDGITALQMDIKIQGLTKQIMAEALDQARLGRLHILAEMAKVINEPRTTYREHVPQIHTIMLPTDKIRDVIGQGGKTIKSIIEKTGVKIDIEDDGKCVIFSPQAKGLKMAKSMIEELIATPEPGKSYLGKVKRIVDFGAFVEILPNQEGLLHISEVANYRVRFVTDELTEGEEVMVKCLSVEPGGRIKLSRRALLEG